VPERGALAVRWEDENVAARSDWSDRGWEWNLRGTGARSAIGLSLVSVDRDPESGIERDRAEPSLAWRSEAVTLGFEARGARFTVDGWHGAGNQSTSVTRSGARYAAASGPLSSAGVTLAVRPRRSTLGGRVWTGRWSGNVAGQLALWPFESVTAVLGTMRVAQSTATLRHAGLAIEREPAARSERKSGLAGGIALWWVEPRASYRTWQATFLGLGRDDYSAGTSSLRSALLAGIKVAPTFHWSGGTARLELVQWLPVRVWKARGAATPGSGDGSPGGGSGAGSGSWTTGGTVVRMTLAR